MQLWSSDHRISLFAVPKVPLVATTENSGELCNNGKLQITVTTVKFGKRS